MQAHIPNQEPLTFDWMRVLLNHQNSPHINSKVDPNAGAQKNEDNTKGTYCNEIKY